MKVRIYFQTLKIKYKTGLITQPLILFILFLFSLPIFANGSYAQGLQKKISLRIKGAPVQTAISNLETASGLQINYDGSIFNSSALVYVDAQNISTENVLKQIIGNNRVGYRSTGNNTIILYKLAPPQAPGRIVGTVVDNKGEPLVGATVMVRGAGQSMMTDSKGNFNLPIKAGNYIIEISFISHQSQRITDVKVSEGKTTSLNIAMVPSANALEQVTVTVGFRKASISGLLARQKNASEISNGISAEQIASTPDQNMGESIKRISGVNTLNNKFVVVRGIGERYNSATLDGTTLPSTEGHSRNFSFDIIPSSIVDNVVVAKSITPDMNTTFGGGLVQINTKDIPTENFMTLSVGTGLNDLSTGKGFLSPKRGKHDYLGFDDGRRDFPTDFKPSNDMEDKEAMIAQSKSFTTDNFTLYQYHAKPAQNYQFAIGRIYNLKGSSLNKLGFTGSLNFRNNQEIVQIDETKRGKWNDHFDGFSKGNTYEFNSTWGGILNVGLQLEKHRFSSRNTLTRIFNNNLTRITGIDTDNADPYANKIKETNVPTFTTLVLNKLTGQHNFGKFKVEWEGARTGIDRKDKDMGIATQFLSSKKINGENVFVYTGGLLSNPTDNISRHNYANKETHYSTSISTTYPFNLGDVHSTVKSGYFYLSRNAEFSWQIANQITIPANFREELNYLPIAERFKPENIGVDGFLYYSNGHNEDYYEGNSKNHAAFVMLDHKWKDKLRLVYGIRPEYYTYNEIRNPQNKLTYLLFTAKKEQHWRWFPSANLTYSPISTLNLRAAYSKTAIRPDLMENSQFERYSPFLDGSLSSSGINSTVIDSWDFKAEWYPGLGEIISAGIYYKYFANPSEITGRQTMDLEWAFRLENAAWAKVYGLEFELRKNLGFIMENPILEHTTVYGNVTLQKGDVMTFANVWDSVKNESVMVESQQKRSLYGQSPYLINAGLQYQGSKFGFNVAINHTGRKTSIISDNVPDIEYEMPRSILDAQVSYKFLNKKLEFKVNASNILNTNAVFYRNTGSYDLNNLTHTDTGLTIYNLLPGHTIDYEKDDKIFYKQRFGRSYSTTLTYKF
ncbi:TonB-dependent receptor domain-containing protein [Sphingobacterium lactis]|uniref:TonB-dependent receptor n=1 Tax=Sphingobacterium lactis TaxID=797291 RepID=UPI003DA51DDC